MKRQGVVGTVGEQKELFRAGGRRKRTKADRLALDSAARWHNQARFEKGVQVLLKEKVTGEPSKQYECAPETWFRQIFVVLGRRKEQDNGER